MAWSATQALWATDPTISATINTYGTDSSVINLNAGESCVIQLKGTSVAGVSDLLFRVLVSNDGGSTWDTVPYMSGSIGHPAAAQPNYRTFVVYGVKTFKVQLAQSATTAWGSCNATYVKDGISA
jgi:hypothetical protein